MILGKSLPLSVQRIMRLTKLVVRKQGLMMVFERKVLPRWTVTPCPAREQVD